MFCNVLLHNSSETLLLLLSELSVVPLGIGKVIYFSLKSQKYILLVTFKIINIIIRIITLSQANDFSFYNDLIAVFR